MSVLYYDGADAPLAERLGAFFLPFDVRPLPATLPCDPLDSLCLIAFPEGLLRPEGLPGGVPFLGFGSVEGLLPAFAAGAKDYLREPWTGEELTVRACRVLGLFDSYRKVRPSSSSPLALEGQVLRGARGIRVLGPDEARVLGILLSEAPGAVSRVALRRIVWPSLGEGSRVVDETISRLRRRIAEVSGAEAVVQIRSIRGFGYALNALPCLWAACG